MSDVPVTERTAAGWAGIFVRGLAMGIAEVVPGVSGGTVAFISGIYDELVATLAGLSKRSPLQFFTEPVAYWRAQNLTFLLVLGLGMMAAIFAFAQLLRYLLDVVPPLVWAFFFGLIAASVVKIGGGVERRMLVQWAPLGVLLGLGMLLLPQWDGNPGLGVFFVGGMIAVSAWLLPAVSGSFMLLVMGIYAPVLLAVSELNLAVLAAVAAGVGVGLLLFARALSWLLARWRDPLLSLLTGFMVGALPNLWPWRTSGDWLTPSAYGAAVGEPFVIYAIGTGLLGILALWALVRLDR